MSKKMWGKSGFTLVELMVVVGIIAILSAIAVPIFMNKVKRAKQVEAKTLLMTIKVEQEQFRAENNCYTTIVDSTTLPQTFKTRPNNRTYRTIAITANDTPACLNTDNKGDDFQAVATGVLTGTLDDHWAISDVIPAPVHCDGRSSYTTDQTAACASVSPTTEMEY